MVSFGGLTASEPDTATAPTPWSMVTVVASVVDQLKVAASPLAIEVGETLRLAVGAGGGGGEPVTVKEAMAVAVPNPVAVIVYVVSPVGLTLTEPLAATTPTPWSIITVAASVVDQVSVADVPKRIVVGEMLRVAVGAGGGGPTVQSTCNSGAEMGLPS